MSWKQSVTGRESQAENMRQRFAFKHTGGDSFYSLQKLRLGAGWRFCWSQSPRSQTRENRISGSLRPTRFCGSAVSGKRGGGVPTSHTTSSDIKDDSHCDAWRFTKTTLERRPRSAAALLLAWQRWRPIKKKERKTLL